MQIYLDRIDYTGNTNTGVEGAKYVRFIRQSRNDAYTMYNTKARVRTASILNWIETYSNGQLAGKYELLYGNGTTSDHSRLTAIKTYESDGTSTLPSQTFQYSVGGNGRFGGGGTIDIGNTIGNTTGETHFIEINGDGLADLLLKDEGDIYTYLSNGNGPPDLATSIDNGNVATTTIQYTPSSQYNNTFLPFIVHPVS